MAEILLPTKQTQDAIKQDTTEIKGIVGAISKGFVEFKTPGIHKWRVPVGVNTIFVTLVGAGGGGGGGGYGDKNTDWISAGSAGNNFSGITGLINSVKGEGGAATAKMLKVPGNNATGIGAGGGGASQYGGIYSRDDYYYVSGLKGKAGGISDFAGLLSVSGGAGGSAGKGGGGGSYAPHVFRQEVQVEPSKEYIVTVGKGGDGGISRTRENDSSSGTIIEIPEMMGGKGSGGYALIEW